MGDGRGVADTCWAGKWLVFLFSCLSLSGTLLSGDGRGQRSWGGGRGRVRWFVVVFFFFLVDVEGIRVIGGIVTLT